MPKAKESNTFTCRALPALTQQSSGNDRNSQKAMLIICFALMTGMESGGFCPDSGYNYLSALPLADNVLI